MDERPVEDPPRLVEAARLAENQGARLAPWPVELLSCRDAKGSNTAMNPSVLPGMGEHSSSLPLADLAMVSAMASPSPEPGPAALPRANRCLRRFNRSGGTTGPSLATLSRPDAESATSIGLPAGEWFNA